MKHFSLINKKSFVNPPIDFNKNSSKDILKFALGATMYLPGTKDIFDAVVQKKWPELTSMVMCFEDAIAEKDLDLAEKNVALFLKKISQAIKDKVISIDELPLLIIRVRNFKQFQKFTSEINKSQITLLTAFNFPKINSSNVRLYFSHLRKLNQTHNINLYGMPIIESREASYIESANKELISLKDALSDFNDLVLNIRVGATDFSSLYGIRRSIYSTVYDVITVRENLSNVLNTFARSEEGYVVSAPVWEYYEQIDLTKKIVSKHLIDDILTRKLTFNRSIDGLIRELIQDINNGFLGKTIIHPSQIKFVNAFHAVTKEEYDDARQILSIEGGVIKSLASNKMNEINPHTTWAKRIIMRSKIYGVIKDSTKYLDLLAF